MTVDVVDAPRRRVMLEELRAHRDEIEEIGRRYGVSNIRVTGQRIGHPISPYPAHPRGRCRSTVRVADSLIAAYHGQGGR